MLAKYSGSGLNKVFVLVLVAVLVAAAAFASTILPVFATEPGAILFEQINFNNDPQHPGGSIATITEDIACLQDTPFNFPENRKTRSVKVVPGTIVILYQKCNFLGNAATFMAHDSNLTKNHGVVFAGKVKSVRIILDEQSLAVRLDAIDEKLDDLLTRVGTPDTTTFPNGDVFPDSNLSDQIASIYNHSNPDPFEVTLQTCVSLGAEANIGFEIKALAKAEGNGSAGALAFGNGVTVLGRLGLQGEASGKLEGALGLSTEACLEGVRVVFDRDHTNAEDAFITAYTTAASGLQTGLRETIGVVGLGVDGLASGMTAIEKLSTGSVDITDPSALVSNTGPFASLSSALPLGKALDLDIDLDAILADLTNPCGISGTIGDLVKAICDDIDETLAEAIKDIKKIVKDIKGLANDIINLF